jgi:hypothetical protein
LKGLTKWKVYRGDPPSSSISSLAPAPLNKLSAVDTNMEAIKITPQTNDEVDNTIFSSEPDSDKEDEEGGREMTSIQHADMSIAGMFSTQLNDKAAQAATDSKENRLQRGCWQKKSEGMTYKERQEYFRLMHKQMEDYRSQGGKKREGMEGKLVGD